MLSVGNDNLAMQAGRWGGMILLFDVKICLVIGKGNSMVGLAMIIWQCRQADGEG